MSVLWVAELGSNHGGSKALCFELIRSAVWAGSNLIKLQIGWTKEAQAKYCASYDERRFIDDWVPDIDAWCKDFGVEWFASIWSLQGLEVARAVGMKRYKIAHQLHDRILTDAICGDDKQVFWSLDGGDNDSSRHEWGDHLVTPVYTTTDYPTMAINDWVKRHYSFGGYSSHMHGIADALIAVARGANYIEKHMTLTKTADWPRDRAFSLVPSEFKQMVEIGNEIARLR